MATFLIIEDNAANLELLRYLLTNAGHAVLSAGDGLEGLAVLRGPELPVLVLCDLRMPRMDGYGFLRAVRNDPGSRDLIVLAVSAYSMPGDSERALAAGFDGYITKPIDPLTVVKTIEAALTRGRPSTG
jgi:CheY-like chemotaxis protein